MRHVCKMRFSSGSTLVRFEQQWNILANKKRHRMIGGAVKFWEDDPEFGKFMQYFKSQQGNSDVILEESITEIQYSDADLFACDMVTLTFGGWAEINATSFESSFDQILECEICGRAVLKQNNDLKITKIVDERDALFVMIQQKNNLLSIARGISEKFWRLLESLNISGVRSQPMHYRKGGHLGQIYQLFVDQRMPQLDRIAKIERTGPCNACGEFTGVYRAASSGTREEELVFSSFNSGQKMALTTEIFGGHAIKTDANRELIVEGSLYALFVREGITGLYAAPARRV